MAKLSVIIPSRNELFLPQTVDDDVFGFVYLITNKHNGKQYVGQTTRSIKTRWKGHLYDAERGNTYPICRAIKKYGIDGFTIKEIARAISLEELDFLESFYISHYNTLKPGGYNLTSGGNNYAAHPDTKAKISKANKGNQYCLGRVLSEETKKKISEAKKGKPSHRKGAKCSEETKEKIRLSKIGKPSWNKGKPWSAEVRGKISASKIGKKGTPHTAKFKDEMSISLIGNQRSKGCKRSEEYKIEKSKLAKKRERGKDGRFK